MVIEDDKKSLCEKVCVLQNSVLYILSQEKVHNFDLKKKHSDNKTYIDM